MGISGGMMLGAAAFLSVTQHVSLPWVTLEALCPKPAVAFLDWVEKVYQEESVSPPLSLGQQLSASPPHKCFLSTYHQPGRALYTHPRLEPCPGGKVERDVRMDMSPAA